MRICSFLGQNCLHLVSIYGYLSLVERLVELGADINAQVCIWIYSLTLQKHLWFLLCLFTLSMYEVLKIKLHCKQEK